MFVLTNHTDFSIVVASTLKDILDHMQYLIDTYPEDQYHFNLKYDPAHVPVR